MVYDWQVKKRNDLSQSFFCSVLLGGTWQRVQRAGRCVAVLSCFPVHAKISTAGMLTTPSWSCRPLKQSCILGHTLAPLKSHYRCVFCRLLASIITGAVRTFPKAPLNKHAHTQVQPLQLRAISLNKYCSPCPPTSKTVTGWGHDSCQVDRVSWFIAAIAALILPNQPWPHSLMNLWLFIARGQEFLCLCLSPWSGGMPYMCWWGCTDCPRTLYKGIVGW